MKTKEKKMLSGDTVFDRVIDLRRTGQLKGIIFVVHASLDAKDTTECQVIESNIKTSEEFNEYAKLAEQYIRREHPDWVYFELGNLALNELVLNNEQEIRKIIKQIDEGAKQ